MAKRKRRTARRTSRSGRLPGLRVRMYRQGLGDCILLTFDPGGDERHMLIDCGTLGATTTKVKLSDVVQDIRTTTGDHLHVLVATHEHLDHVSGFRVCREQFEAMTVDEVWLAWTENSEDPLARQIVKVRNDLHAALTEAARALTAEELPAGARQKGETVEALLGFFDPDPLGATAFAPTVDEAMEFVRSGTGARTRYFSPGDGPLEDDPLPGFRVFVLGPPRSEQAIYRLGSHGSSELYALAAALRCAAVLAAAGKPAAEVFDAGGQEATAFAATLPFDVRFRHEASSDTTKHLFETTYFAPDAAWRRIDGDWLHLAVDLALQLDNATNNTSLVLAIERVADGKVLLFPGDAQEGSWLSWHDAGMQWTVQGGPHSATVTARDLLSRTVFYKVGHHSSHNATARTSGLELMTREQDLTAFIPVDRAVALGRNPKGSWKMPALALYRRLLERCRGRVARSDLGWAADAAGAANKDAERALVGIASADEWTGWHAEQKKATHVSVKKLYLDYLLQ